ncbi:MAG: hypothetical protein WB681_14495 [Candidatus Cybelea sp.]
MASDATPEREYVVAIEPLRCSWTLASAKWDRSKLMDALMDAVEPQCASKSYPVGALPDAIIALADAIIAATGQEVEELKGDQQ